MLSFKTGAGLMIVLGLCACDDGIGASAKPFLRYATPQPRSVGPITVHLQTVANPPLYEVSAYLEGDWNASGERYGDDDGTLMVSRGKHTLTTARTLRLAALPYDDGVRRYLRDGRIFLRIDIGDPPPRHDFECAYTRIAIDDLPEGPLTIDCVPRQPPPD